MKNQKNIIKDEKGFALLLTLFVSAILTVIILEFSQSIKIDSMIASNYSDQVESYAIASSGIEFAKFALKTDAPEYDALSEDWAKDYSKILSTVMFKRGKLSLYITDESSKINVNTVIATPKKGQPPVLNRPVVDNLKHLCELTNQDYKFVDALVDWIDDNDEVTFFEGQQESGGAEDMYYQTMDPPYRCKNAPLDTIQELFFIKGFNDETYFGTQDNEEENFEITKTGIKDFITVYGDSTININTAPAEVIKSLNLDIDDTVAENLIKTRDESPFKSVNEIKAIAGINPKVFEKIKKRIAIKSNGFFSVRSVGRINNIITEINAVLYRSSNSEVNIVYWKLI